VGLDIDLLSLRQARKIYDDVVLADARYLPFREGSSFDIVTCLELIEHIPKREGIVLLRNLSALASKKLVVSTPSYFFELPAPSNGVGYGHVSFYSPKELKELGFETHGLRVRALAGKNSLIIGIIRAVLAPLTYFFPSTAACTIGVKQTREEWLSSRKAVRTGRRQYGSH